MLWLFFSLMVPVLVAFALGLVVYYSAPHVPLDGRLNSLVSFAMSLSVLVLVPADGASLGPSFTQLRALRRQKQAVACAPGR